MTEVEWLVCGDPRPMLRFLEGKASDRKRRLFACACCRRIWHLIPDEYARHAVACGEEYADGRLAGWQLMVANGEVERALRAPGALHGPSRQAYQAVWQASNAAWPWPAPHLAAEAAAVAVKYRAREGRGAGRPSAQRERAGQCALLRDLFNPFRPVALDPAWNNGTILKLAQALYEDRALPSGHLNDLPILADALEDAGCDNADILNHCRHEGPHVRGCWVVDLLPDK
jgi:hypothetical protein